MDMPAIVAVVRMLRAFKSILMLCPTALNSLLRYDYRVNITSSRLILLRPWFWASSIYEFTSSRRLLIDTFLLWLVIFFVATFLNLMPYRRYILSSFCGDMLTSTYFRLKIRARSYKESPADLIKVSWQVKYSKCSSWFEEQNHLPPSRCRSG